jgi:hypothetical protein
MVFFMVKKMPATKRRATKTPTRRKKLSLSDIRKRLTTQNIDQPVLADSSRAIATLLELMTTSDSDSVRIAAAKAYLDRTQTEAEMPEPKKKQERLEAIRAISRLLDELAAAKAASLSEAAKLDQPGATKPANAGG